MKSRFLIGAFITCALINIGRLQARPVHLTVQPQGTNQIELTMSPVEHGAVYEVIMRTNSPEGHWMTLSGFIAGTSNILSVTCSLSRIPGLTLTSLPYWTFVAGRWDDPLGDELPPLYKELVLRTDPFASGDPYGDPMGDGWSINPAGSRNLKFDPAKEVHNVSKP